jgi:hypothetical protein
MEPEYFKYIGKWVTDEDWKLDSYCLVKKIEDGKVYYSKAFDYSIIYRERYNDYWNNKRNLRIVELSEVIKKAKHYEYDLKSLGLEEKNDYSQYIGQWVTYSGWQENSYCLFKNIEGNRLYFSVGFQEDKLDKNDWWTCSTPKKLKIIPSLEMAEILQQFRHTDLIDTLLDVLKAPTVKEASKDLIINYPFSTKLNTIPEIKLNNKQFKF